MTFTKLFFPKQTAGNASLTPRRRPCGEVMLADAGHTMFGVHERIAAITRAHSANYLHNATVFFGSTYICRTLLTH
jgi:hypothetical protein